MKKNSLFAALIITTICFTPLIHAQSASDGVTAEDIKKEALELRGVLQQYTTDRRDDAFKLAEQALNNLDGRIDELESSIDNNWDTMSQAARRNVRANLRALRQQRNELAEWYGGFKNSSADAWEHMKKGFSDAYDATTDSWEKVKAEYENDN